MNSVLAAISLLLKRDEPMTKHSRITLREYFKNGNLPNSEHYSDFIDSTVNRLDDGFDKSDKYGLRLTSHGGYTALLSFDTKEVENESEPFWIVKHGKTNHALHFQSGWKTDNPSLKKDGSDQSTETGDGTEKAKGSEPGTDKTTPAKDDTTSLKKNRSTAAVLTLDEKGKVGINKDKPKWALDVDGVIRSQGRIGFPRVAAEIKADRKWHYVTDELEGCHALEIVAGVGGCKGKGRYSLLHATAMNAYNPRNWILNLIFSRRKIRKQTAVFGRYSDRIKLRWHSKKDSTRRLYRLQMKTASIIYSDKKEEKDYAFIRYYITQLWFDSEMEDSRQQSTDLDPKKIKMGQAE